MQTSNVYKWITKEDNRKNILMSMKQPLTAKQISKKTGLCLDTCSYVLGKFTVKGIGTCLNPDARNSRLYWVTDIGQECLKRLHQELSLPEKAYDIPSVNWGVYGWVCFSHRAAIIRTLAGAMQPSEIKRALRVHKPCMKISANNIRDVVRLFQAKGIVQKVFVRKKVHPRYELTETGSKFQGLLSRAEEPV